jgi:arylsulfatase A-like enzyme
MRSRRLVQAIAGCAAALALALLLGGSAGAAADSPNIILILTDDQASYEFERSVMPQTNALIRDRGVTFNRFYTSYPLCCPSRATFLTGQYMHNHHVRGNLPPNGGQHVFDLNGSEAHALPVWLQNAGYETAHIGKYLNGYGDDGTPQVPAGWSEWYGQISDYDPAEVGGRLYYEYNLLEKGLGPGPGTLHHYDSAPADYQGDVLIDKTLGAIDDLSGTGDPFYIEFAPHAPHYPFTPPPRYQGTAGATWLPPLPGVNEKDISDKPLFLRQEARGKLKPATLASLAASRRERLEQLHSVDDYVGQIVGRLAALGELDNTYLVFASDNGYFFGEHRIIAGKYLAYEPSSRVPFAIAGPGIPHGAVSSELVSNADFAPTVAQLAGASPTLTVDGRSMVPFARNPGARSGRPVLLEADVGPGTGTRSSATRLPGGFSRHGDRVRPRVLSRLHLLGSRGAPDLEQEPGAEPKRLSADGDSGPAYKAIRTNRWVFTIYATGETELYDMVKDPAQLTNLRARRYRRVKRILLARLINLASCAGPNCNTTYARDPKSPDRKKKKKGKKRKAKGGRNPSKAGR